MKKKRNKGDRVGNCTTETALLPPLLVPREAPGEDLILLDVLLSDADGRMLSRRLKNQNTTKHIPIVLMGTSLSVAATLTKSGAEAFLKKPFDLDGFLATIHTYV